MPMRVTILLSELQRKALRGLKNVRLERKNVKLSGLAGISLEHASFSNSSAWSQHSGSAASFTSAIDILKKQVEGGNLVHDESQLMAAKRLSKLQTLLFDYDKHYIDLFPKDNCSKTDRSTNESASKINKSQILPQIPRGLFLYGEVGTGKSFLMDIFFNAVPLEKKRRVHFHAFMQDIHSRVHQLKQLDLQTHGRNFHVDTSLQRNPIFRVAMDLADEVKLLCFDEFQVTDVADALILSQLFSVLFRRGTIMVATSNRPPADLYEGGLNRSYFLPFIDLLCKHCLVYNMNSNVDYRRLLASSDQKCFFFIMDEVDARSREGTSTSNSKKQYDHIYRSRECDKIFSQLKENSKVYAEESDNLENRILNIGHGRSFVVKKQSYIGNICCRFQFADLCKVNLGSTDYRAIANQFRVVIIENIPCLTLKEHNEARRFITLVDELYEAKVCLICSAFSHPDNLFFDSKNDDSKFTELSGASETEPLEMFGIDVAQSNGKQIGELASVRELSFAFRRASSRIVEMTSTSWWDKYMDFSLSPEIKIDNE